MKTSIVKVPYIGKGTMINIEPLSDIHVGSVFHDKVKFKERVNYIQSDPNRYTILMGDSFDMTLPDHKFFDAKTQDPDLPELEDQFQYLLNMLLPIRHKILAVLTGNHDERLRLKHGQDFVSRLVRELNLEYPASRNVPDLSAAGLRLVDIPPSGNIVTAPKSDPASTTVLSGVGQDLPYKIRYLG